MRVVLDTRSFFMRTGTARYAREMARALTAAGSEHEYLLLISDRHDPKEVDLGGGRWRAQVSTAPWLGGQAESDALAREVRDWGADLFHSFFPPQSVHGVPSVVTLFDLIPLTHPHLHRQDVVDGFRLGLERALDGAAAIVAISDATRAEAVRVYPHTASRVVVLPCGLSQAFLEPPPPIARREGVLSVATIEPRKGIQTVVAAARHLTATWRTIPFTVAGKAGWGQYDIERDIQNLPNVRYAGYVPDADLIALYRRASLFVYPSEVEGFGLPILEAMSQGALPIVSTTPASRELVPEHDQQVPAGDPTALAAVIRHWYERPAERALRAAALRSRTRAFRWEAVAQACLRLYERVSCGPVTV